MPPRRFDPDHALAQAMDLFWAKGYEATSAQDLVEAMGISRGSLYATFGSKRQLYLQALERYLTRDRAKLGTALAGAGEDLHAALTGLLTLYAAQLAADPERRGCFMANACAELTTRDTDVANRLAAELRIQEGMLADALLAARRRGEHIAAGDEHQLAAYLMSAILGARIIAKATPDGDHLAAILTLALNAVLPPPTTSTSAAPPAPSPVEAPSSAGGDFEVNLPPTWTGPLGDR